MPFLGAGLHILLALACAIHAVRHGRSMYWLFILFAFPLLGSIVYFVAEWLPDLRQSYSVQKAGRSVARSLDPGRELRAARRAVELTPTVENRVRLARALLAAGDGAAAVAEYAQCVQGPYSSDAALVTDLAEAQLETGDAAGAQATIARFRSAHPGVEPPALLLAQARALVELGDPAAGELFEVLVKRAADVEVKCRYAEWLKTRGDAERARALFGEVVEAARHWTRHARNLNREWLGRAEKGLRG